MDSAKIAALVGSMMPPGVQVLHQSRPDPALEAFSALLGTREAHRHLGVDYVGPRKKPSTPTREKRNKRNKAAKIARRRNRR